MENVHCGVCHCNTHRKKAQVDVVESSPENTNRKKNPRKIVPEPTLSITNHTHEYVCTKCNQAMETYHSLKKSSLKKHIERFETLPENPEMKTEYIESLKSTLDLFHKYEHDNEYKKLHEVLTRYLNNDGNLGLNNHNRITNGFNIDNNNVVGNGTSESSSVNLPFTNQLNISTNNINHTFNNFENNPIAIITNTLNSTINSGATVFQIPSVVTNNGNNSLAVSNRNRPSIRNGPIICTNNVIKSGKFGICKQPQTPGESRVASNIVPNKLRNAVVRNQSNGVSPATIKSTGNHKNVQSNVNEIKNDDEVICLDDDDDDDDDNNDVQLIEPVTLVNNWVRSNNLSKNIKTYSRKNQKNASSKMLKMKRRKTVPIENNVLSTKIPTEEMTVTPDMLIPNIELDLSLNQSENMYFNVPSQVHIEPPELALLEPETTLVTLESRLPVVTPNTGFHFLFESEQTIDLTNKDDSPRKIVDNMDQFNNQTIDLTNNDDTPKKKAIKRKKTNIDLPKKTATPKKQCQKTSIVVQHNVKTPNQLPSTSFATPTATNKKQCQKTSIVVQHNVKTPNQLPSTSFATPTATNKRQCQKTSIVHNVKTPNQLPSTSFATPTATNRSHIPSTNARPKRSSAIASTVETQNTGVLKLGKHIDFILKVKLERISLDVYKCPICDVILYSKASRKKHESKHSKLLESLNKPVNTVTPTVESEDISKLYLFNYLELGYSANKESKAINQLAKSPHLLKSFKAFGKINKGPLKCSVCEYETNFVFILWAHVTSCHPKNDSEKKSCSYCYLCDRTLNKRVTMLKHVDSCIKNHLDASPTQQPPIQLNCQICNYSCDSLSKLEQHSWVHT